MFTAVGSLITSNPSDNTKDDGFITDTVAFALCNVFGDVSAVGNNFDQFLYSLLVLENNYTKDDKEIKETGVDILYLDDLSFYTQYIIWELEKNFTRVDDLRKKTSSPYKYSVVRSDNVTYKISIKVDKQKKIDILNATNIIRATGHDLISDDDYTKYNSENYDYCQFIAIKKMYSIKKLLREFLNDSKPGAMTVGQLSLDRLKSNIGKDRFNAYYGPYTVNKQLHNLLNDNIEKTCREAYVGGFTWLNPKYKEVEVNNVIDLDINSLYPYVMYSFDLPYGVPCEMDKIGSVQNQFYIIRCQMHAKLKPNHIPCFRAPGDIIAGINYVTEITPDTDIVISSPMYCMISQQYDILYINVKNVLAFDVRNSFRSYIGNLYSKKKEATGARREFYKLMLDTIHGKFGSKPYRYKTIPKNTKSGLTWVRQDSDDKFVWSYVPLAIAVSDYAKLMIISYAQRYYDKLIYIDTDSIHLTDYCDGIDLPIGNEIGQFKVEFAASHAIYYGPKKYIYMTADGWKTKMSGLTSQTTLYKNSNLKTVKSFRGVNGRLFYETDYSV